MPTANAMNATTAPRIVSLFSRGVTQVAGIDVSPIVSFAYISRYPPEPRMYRLTALSALCEDALTLIALLSAVGLIVSPVVPRRCLRFLAR